MLSSSNYHQQHTPEIFFFQRHQYHQDDENNNSSSSSTNRHEQKVLLRPPFQTWSELRGSSGSSDQKQNNEDDEDDEPTTELLAPDDFIFGNDSSQKKQTSSSSMISFSRIHSKWLTNFGRTAKEYHKERKQQHHHQQSSKKSSAAEHDGLQATASAANLLLQKSLANSVPEADVYALTPSWISYLDEAVAESVVSQQQPPSISIFAQRHPLVYSEGQMIAKDIMKLAAWMMSEYHETLLAKEKYDEQQLLQQIYDEATSRKRDEEAKTEMLMLAAEEEKNKKEQQQRAVSSNRSSARSTPAAADDDEEQHRGPTTPDATHDGVENDDENENENQSHQTEEGRRVENNNNNNRQSSSTVSTSSSKPSLSRPPSAQKEDNNNTHGNEDQSDEQEVDKNQPQQVSFVKAEDIISKHTTTASPFNNNPSPFANTPLYSSDEEKSVAILQNSIQLYFLAMYLHMIPQVDDEVEHELKFNQRWSLSALRSLAKMASLEVSVVMPKLFLKRIANMFYEGFQSDDVESKRSTKLYDAPAKLLASRIAQWLAGSWGRFLIGSKLLSQASSPSATTVITILDPSLLCRCISATRFQAELTLGLPPTPPEPPKSKMFDRATVNRSVISLSETITRRARHVRFAFQPVQLSSMSSFRSRPKSPPPEATTNVFAKQQKERDEELQRKSAEEQEERQNNNDDKNVANNTKERETSATKKPAEVKSNNNNNNNDNKNKKESPDRPTSTAKRPAGLFDDIPIAEEFYDDDDAEENVIGEALITNSDNNNNNNSETRKESSSAHGLISLIMKSDTNDSMNNNNNNSSDDDDDFLASHIKSMITAPASPRVANLVLKTPSRGVAMAERLKALLLEPYQDVPALNLRHLLPIQTYNLITAAIRRGVNLASVAQVRSVGLKMFRESGILVSPATVTRFVDALRKLEKINNNNNNNKSSAAASNKKKVSSSNNNNNKISLSDVLAALDLQIGIGMTEVFNYKNNNSNRQRPGEKAKNRNDNNDDDEITPHVQNLLRQLQEQDFPITTSTIKTTSNNNNSQKEIDLSSLSSLLIEVPSVSNISSLQEHQEKRLKNLIKIVTQFISNYTMMGMANNNANNHSSNSSSSNNLTLDIMEVDSIISLLRETKCVISDDQHDGNNNNSNSIMIKRGRTNNNNSTPPQNIAISLQAVIMAIQDVIFFSSLSSASSSNINLRGSTSRSPKMSTTNESDIIFAGGDEHHQNSLQDIMMTSDQGGTQKTIVTPPPLSTKKRFRTPLPSGTTSLYQANHEAVHDFYFPSSSSVPQTTTTSANYYSPSQQQSTGVAFYMSPDIVSSSASSLPQTRPGLIINSNYDYHYSAGQHPVPPPFGYASNSSFNSPPAKEFPFYPVPGQFRVQRELKKSKYYENNIDQVLKNASTPPRPFSCFYDRVPSGLEEKPVVGNSDETTSVELVALRRQMSTSKNIVELSQSCPKLVPSGNASKAAKALSSGVETVAGVKALRSLTSDQQLRLGAPSNIQELRPCTAAVASSKGSGLSQPSWRSVSYVTSTLDENHRRNRRELKKIRRETTTILHDE